MFIFLIKKMKIMWEIRWKSNLFFYCFDRRIFGLKTCDFLMIYYIYEMKMRAKTFCVLGVLCIFKNNLVCEIFISLFFLHFLETESSVLSYLI